MLGLQGPAAPLHGSGKENKPSAVGGRQGPTSLFGPAGAPAYNRKPANLGEKLWTGADYAKATGGDPRLRLAPPAPILGGLGEPKGESRTCFGIARRNPSIYTAVDSSQCPVSVSCVTTWQTDRACHLQRQRPSESSRPQVRVLRDTGDIPDLPGLLR